MKIALAQINSTIGDFDGNIARIVESAGKARSLGADLVLCPEQVIPGYPAHDLLERRRFIEQNLAALESLARQVTDIGLVVGFAERSGKSVGKGLYNSAALLDDGKIVSMHRKCLLPTYDVFDESRYFDPADEPALAVFRGVKLGITICEDVWNDPEFWPHRLYQRDPAGELVERGAEILINVAASPFTVEKRHLRREMLRTTAQHHRRPLLFVNSVGGNDELVFDGASLAFDAGGQIIARGAEFAEDLVIVDLDASTGDIRPGVGDDDEAALAALTLGTKDYAGKCGFKSAILGLSGGVDSALVASVGAAALGPQNITCVLMPSRYSSIGSVKDAEQLARNLGVQTHTIPIDPIFSRYLDDLAPLFKNIDSGIAEENIQSRIRGALIMALSNKFGHLVLTTGNKSELATGYCTLYGDMVGGLAILADVPKTLVYRLCAVVNQNRETIPQAILDKAPSAELKPNQRDTDSLPPYDILDALVEKHIVHGFDGPALIGEGFDPEVVGNSLRLIRASEYKRRQAAPGLKLTSKAFGYGRRIPLAQRWRP